jgi:hypothetical protein
MEDADSVFPISVLTRNRIGRLLLEIIEGKNPSWQCLHRARLHRDEGGKVGRLGCTRWELPLGQGAACAEETPHRAVWTKKQIGPRQLGSTPRGGKPLGCYVGYAQERDPASGWAREEVSGHDRWKIWKRLFIFQILSKFQTDLNSNQIWISMTSIHKIKYKNTWQPKGKYASAWNATIK